MQSIIGTLQFHSFFKNNGLKLLFVNWLRSHLIAKICVIVFFVYGIVKTQKTTTAHSKTVNFTFSMPHFIALKNPGIFGCLTLKIKS